jgi:hypothetical protein
MAWYEDLAECTYFGSSYSPFLRAVGWLEFGRPFPTGRVDPAVYARLLRLLKNAWQPGIFIGFHRCDLCLYEGQTGKRNLFLPTEKCVYVCPELVTHYMNEHGYRPPDEFRAAVLACPEMRTVPYFKALLAMARPLVKGE